MKLAFVELGVRDLGASLRWYKHALGLATEVLDEARGFVLLHDTHGGKLALKEGVPGSVRLQWEVANLEVELNRMAGLGFHPEGEPHTSSEGYRRATFRDPDGNAIALYEWVRCA